MALYGRCMSKREYRAFLDTGFLVGSKEQGTVPVFIADDTTRDILYNMKKDERRTLFGSIGVTQPDMIVIFETDVEPLPGVVPQRGPRLQKEDKFRKPVDTSFIQQVRFVPGKIINPTKEIDSVPENERIGSILEIVKN